MIAGIEDAIRTHRDVVNRAIGMLNNEVFGFAHRLDKDDEARATRQKEVDSKLDTIQSNQERQRVWQWIRIGIELATAIIIIAAILTTAAIWIGSR